MSCNQMCGIVDVAMAKLIMLKSYLGAACSIWEVKIRYHAILINRYLTPNF